MTKLYTNGKMTAREQANRIMVNTTIENMKKFGRFNENELKNWLLLQVTGFEKDGIQYVFPNTFTYEESVAYFNEIVNTGCFE